MKRWSLRAWRKKILSEKIFIVKCSSLFVVYEKKQAEKARYCSFQVNGNLDLVLFFLGIY